MPCVGFELTIPASERAKTVHALDRSATVTGVQKLGSIINKKLYSVYMDGSAMNTSTFVN
jgi:hypothetical protein